MALPKIVGTIVRDVHLECTVGADKEYRLTVAQQADGSFTVFRSHGPRGKMNNGGVLKDKNGRALAGVSEGVAQQGVADQIADKLRGHYVLTGDDRPRASAGPAQGGKAAPAAKAAKAPRRVAPPTAASLGTHSQSILKRLI